jgi:RNA polymerase sigma factor (sigma-70 family)
VTRARRSSYEDAFDGLAAVARRVAFRLLGDGHEAEEAGQEALARAYVRWSRVEPYAEAWVARVAANLALDRHRARARAHRHRGDVVLVAPDGAEPLALRLELVAGLRALPRRQREVVVLRYLADVSEAATAELLGCTPGTVKQHASRGLAALRLTVPDPSGPPSAPRSLDVRLPR